MKSIFCGMLLMVAAGSSATHGSAKEKLIGAWHLVQIHAPGKDGKSISAQQPKGMLIYTRDGHMSVQLMYPAAANVPDNQYIHNGYEASFGSYDINEVAQTVTHHVGGSNTREALTGKDLPRHYEFTRDGRLILRSVDTKETWSVIWEHE